jgi:hypothetical protein
MFIFIVGGLTIVLHPRDLDDVFLISYHGADLPYDLKTQ